MLFVGEVLTEVWRTLAILWDVADSERCSYFAWSSSGKVYYFRIFKEENVYLAALLSLVTMLKSSAV